jgi:hypothetical protein
VFSDDRLFRTDFVRKGKTGPNILPLEIQPQYEKIMSHSSFLAKLFLYLSSGTSSHLDTKYVSSFLMKSAFPSCFWIAITLVMLTRVSHVGMCWKPEKDTYDFDFQSYWVFTVKMVKTSKHPSHFILFKRGFQQQPSTSRDHNSQTVDPRWMG